MLQYYIDFWKNYFNFSGRSRRAAYWYAALMNFIVLLILNVLDRMVQTVDLFSGLYTLAAFIPGIAICVRRLHDIGKAGWWYLLVFVPVVGQIILFIWFICEGDHGNNVYGADPKEVQIL